MEGKHNELLVTQHNQFSKPISLINNYGEQECRSTKESTEESWNEVLTILSSIEAEGGSSVICGDLN